MSCTTSARLIEEADIVGDWQRPAFDLATQSIGVLDGERLVAYAEVYKARWGDGAVDPAYRGLGIGTALSHWCQEVTARDGHARRPAGARRLRE